MIFKIKLSILSLVCSLAGIGTTQIITQDMAEKDSPFENPFIYIFMVLGIVITLGKDIRDPKRKSQQSWSYIIWSLAISIGLSALTAVAWEEGLIGRFTTYLIVVFVSAFAPLIIDKYSDRWVDKTGEAVEKAPKKLLDKLFGPGKAEEQKDEEDGNIEL